MKIFVLACILMVAGCRVRTNSADSVSGANPKNCGETAKQLEKIKADNGFNSLPKETCAVDADCVDSVELLSCNNLSCVDGTTAARNKTNAEAIQKIASSEAYVNLRNYVKQNAGTCAVMMPSGVPTTVFCDTQGNVCNSKLKVP